MFRSEKQNDNLDNTNIRYYHAMRAKNLSCRVGLNTIHVDEGKKHVR